MNEVHKNYLNAAINELEVKLKAVEELNEAIYYLEMHYNYTGSTHGSEANDLMINAVNYQNKRVNIVQENPELFS